VREAGLSFQNKPLFSIMNARQILAQAALAVLHPKEFGLEIDFNMRDYISGEIRDNPKEINSCGTSLLCRPCCIAGWVTR
jgi:hypothetical protein